MQSRLKRMNKRPSTFAHLLRRLAAPVSAAVHGHQPLIASATEVGETEGESSRSWVILHSISELDVRLIHPRPLAASELDVQIAAASGEILRVTLAPAESKKKGELYETTAQFLH